MDTMPSADSDPSKTNGWVESLNAVIREEGAERARFVLVDVLERVPESHDIEASITEIEERGDVEDLHPDGTRSRLARRRA